MLDVEGGADPPRGQLVTGRPRNGDEMRAYRESVMARRQGQQLGNGQSGGGGSKGGCVVVLVSWIACAAGIVARVRGWSA